MTYGLMDDGQLQASAVVANCAMNRERQLDGVNSYTRELGFNPVEWVTARIHQRADSVVGWLDLCCGAGRALHQAADQLIAAGLDHRAALVGVDLVDAFGAVSPGPLLQYVCTSVTEWQPPRPFDLITCVHGLHYIGDKLGLLARAASWLTDTGLLIADLDLAAVRLDGGPSGGSPGGRPAGRPLTTALRAAGFSYDPRRHRISRTGRADIDLPYTYLGADDHAGPNYTGQPAVNSHYARR